MSLNKIKKCLKQIDREDIGSFWLDENISNLLFAIADHLLEMGKEHEETDDMDPESLGMIRVKDFCQQEKIFATGTIYALSKRDPVFADKCTYKLGNKMYVYPNACRDYLKSLPRFKKILERFERT